MEAKKENNIVDIVLKTV